MKINEDNQTRKLIIEALLELLKHKDYHDITIARMVDEAGLGRRTFYRYFKTKDEVMRYTTKLLMNDFAKNLILNQADTLESVTKSYFEFWENYIDVLLLLNKARLLYFIEDNLIALFSDVAIQVGHVPSGLNKTEVNELYNQYKYEFAFKFAGFWKMTIIWCTENPRKSPEEMSKLICEMLK